MVDTLGLYLPVADVGRPLFDAVPPRLDSGSLRHVWDPKSGDEYVTGQLGNLSVLVRPHHVQIRRGSLCKWHMGDNYHTLKRADIRQALERLSDTLGLPMQDADVTRLDWGATMGMPREAVEYLCNLQGLKGFSKMPMGLTSLYYKGRGPVGLCFYDKNAETTKGSRAGDAIPPDWVGKNALRYELQYKGGPRQIAKAVGRPCLLASTLYEADFFNELSARWQSTYKSIEKKHNENTNFDMVKTAEDLKLLGLYRMIEDAGGLQDFLAYVKQRTKDGHLTKMQGKRLRDTATKAYEVVPPLLAVSISGPVEELDAAIDDAFSASML